MATQFPSNYASFGLVTETGVITDNITWDYSVENKRIRNGTGNTIGKTYFDEVISINFTGFIPTTTPFATTLAAALTLVTTPADYLSGSVGSLTVVEGINRTHSNEDYKRLEITAMHHPLLTA